MSGNSDRKKKKNSFQIDDREDTFFLFHALFFHFHFQFSSIYAMVVSWTVVFSFSLFFWWFAVAHCPRCVYGRNFLFTTWWMDSQSKKWSNALKIIFIIGAALILFVHFALKLSFLLCWKTFFLLLFLTLFFDNNNVQICFSLSLSRSLSFRVAYFPLNMTSKHSWSLYILEYLLESLSTIPQHIYSIYGVGYKSMYIIEKSIQGTQNHRSLTRFLP